MTHGDTTRPPATTRRGADPAGELVEAHLPLVGRLVQERLRSVPARVRADDLVSAGMMALVLSARAYDPDRGVPFACFATLRIRGALNDELRSMDWAPRSLRRRARLAETVTTELTVSLNRAPTAHEVAVAMDVGVSDLAALQSELRRSTLVSLHDVAEAGDVIAASDVDDGPESLLLQRERLESLRHAVAALPERLQAVVRAHYFEHRLMRDIATDLGVTQSRVSQMCTQALGLMREGLRHDRDGDPGGAAGTGSRPAGRVA